MVESDEEYVQEISDDEAEAHQVTRGGKTSSRAKGRGAKVGEWDVKRTWEEVEEGADGTITSTIEGLIEANKRKRLLKDQAPFQRGFFRHVVLILDLSDAMAEKDLRPSRYILTLKYVSEFITEFFESNPLGQLGIIGMRDGLAVRVSDMGNNPTEHLNKLRNLRQEEPKGQPSLQNALKSAWGLLYHAPSDVTREVLLLFGALLTSDPGDIHSTITELVSSQIYCSVVGLAAQLAICRTLVTRTNPNMPWQNYYGVALDEFHYRELIMRAVPPREIPGSAATDDSTSGTGKQSAANEARQPSLKMMGFPSRKPPHPPSLCACHSKAITGGYSCTRCSSLVCSLPATCPVCKLMLVESTQLSRSYHLLFPVQNWKEVSWVRAAEVGQNHCFACLCPFPMKSVDVPKESGSGGGGSGSSSNSKGVTGSSNKDGVSESGRYECVTCEKFFCSDCDYLCHEVVHNCPGCQSTMPMGNEAGGEGDQMDVDNS
ncbi:MAG: hypothetical protein LQ351_005296 [Letrouitia transgressa]|nr:MAG: hypothetical protein LQ351_005296 [Letrouitia transgressa]